MYIIQWMKIILRAVIKVIRTYWIC